VAQYYACNDIIFCFNIEAMNLRELNSGTPQTKQWLKPVFGSVSAGESVYEHEDTPTVLPNAGSSKLYVKNDNKVYTIDSNGVERIVGDGVGDLTDLENKTQNIDLAGTSPNLTRINGVVVPNSIRIRDTTTVDLRLVGDNRVALNNIDPAGAPPILAVFNNVATNGVAAAIQIAKNGSSNNGCQLQYVLDETTPANNHACLVIQGSAFNCGLELYQDGRAIFEGTNVQMTSATVNGNITAQTINNLTPAGGSFAQTSSVVIANTTVESTIIGSGEGSVSVPANKFRLGGSYRVSSGGVMSCLNNTDLTIRLYGGATGSTLLGTIPTITIPTSTGKWWGLEFYFTIRALGGAGVASFSFRGKYEQNVDSQNALIGQSVHSIENTNFDTTILNTLNITAEWGSASASNTFTTTQCVLYVIW